MEHWKAAQKTNDANREIKQSEPKPKSFHITKQAVKKLYKM